MDSHVILTCRPQWCDLLRKIDFITLLIWLESSSYHVTVNDLNIFSKVPFTTECTFTGLAWTLTVCLNVILLKCWGHWPFAQVGLDSVFNRGLRAQPSEWRCSHWVIASVSLLLRATWCHLMSGIKFDHNWWKVLLRSWYITLN